jgi:hypothetical protein
MIRRQPRPRSGITLTEILISIMILGVGMVSLATLFPLGLLRIREANRNVRSALLVESALADLQARNLLSGASFRNPFSNPFTYGYTPDPWIYDTTGYQQKDPSLGGANQGAWITSGPGIPVAYDPLWRALVPNSAYSSNPNYGGYGYYLNWDGNEARFGSGLGFINYDPSGGGNPSAHGLQRLTNINPAVYTTITDRFAASIFVSPEDIVFQEKVNSTGGNVALQALSTVVPDMTQGTPNTDYRYSWMFTGRRADAFNDTVYDGDIVIFENRPFSIDPVPNAPYSNQMSSQMAASGVPMQVAGETVVEGVFGYSANAPAGYALGADKVVLLRWNHQMPDPDVRVGGWIADVTYERVAATSATKFPGPYPGQRCYWYQVVKKSPPDNEGTVSTGLTVGLGDPNFRCMTVWIGTPLKAKTQLSGGLPVYRNAALVDPYVINVFSRTVYTR